MKNINKIFSFIILTVVALSFFLLANVSGKESVFASTTFANASNQLRLVGYNGYQPSDYFSGFERAKTAAPSNFYYDHEGKLTQEYNVIKADNKLINGYSTGVSSFAPFGDYIALANGKVLNAYARAGIVSGTGDKNRVTITLSQGQQTVGATNIYRGSTSPSGIYTPHYFETNSFEVQPDKNISFTFKNNAPAGTFDTANFMLFEPSIFFTTQINQIYLTNQSQDVYPNDIIELKASNDVLNITQTGDLISYYKHMHKISYEILEGADKAQIIGNYIYFNNQSSGLVKIRAKALRNSDKNDYIYSQTLTYNLNAQQIPITVNKNFPTSANIVGAGTYYLNEQATLIATINSGYTFSHWLYNGQKITTKNLYFTVKETNDIQFFAIKDIKVDEVIIKDKVYDGTTFAEIEKIVVKGILPYHDANISNLTATYFTPSAGTKILMFDKLPELLGEDAKWYNLSQTLPTTTGTILKRNLLVKMDEVSKVYGEQDPEFTYTAQQLVEGDELTVQISRQAGEDVGRYEIYIEASNLNYIIETEANHLTILKKEIFLDIVQYEKIYDANASLTFTTNFQNIEYSDKLFAEIVASFAQKEVHILKKITIHSITLNGDCKQNYFIDIAKAEVYGTIKPKQITATIQNQTKVYGEEDKEFFYNFEGVVEGDLLQEKVVREKNENVGTYALNMQIHNSNYTVLVSGAPTLTITKKPLQINVEKTSKIYGESDFEISYQTEGLLNDDTLEGNLSRTAGETVGKYNILLGTLKNDNYTLNLISEGFEIVKRQLNISITFESKVYDGTRNIAGVIYTISNTVFGDNITLDISAHFKQKDVGENILIEINSISLNNNNYFFTPSEYYSSITKRPININVFDITKTYGNQDPEINFEVENLVSGETLNGKLARASGENVGNYQIDLGTLISQNNPNYTVILSNTASLTIERKTINITPISQEKHFGNQDPQVTYKILNNDSLAFDDQISSIVSGAPTRVLGELPGIYAYTNGNVFSINNNYIVVYIAGGALNILKANLTVSAVSASKTYGDMDPLFEYETSQQVVENFEFNLLREQGENIGEYKINYVSLYSEFYNITFNEATFTINPRQISLKPAEQTKFYGDNDPAVTYHIVSGILINGDTLQNILSGQAQRETGENIGQYQINVGSLKISQNYSLMFVPSNLTIIKQEIEILAENKQKQFNTQESELTFVINKGFVAFDDEFSGSLEREQGQDIGIYAITQGTLALNDNYNITFVDGLYQIIKAQIMISVDNIEKEYGNQDPEINFEITGNYHPDYALQGNITREAGEEVGEFDFISSLNSPYYETSYSLGKFIINKRIIKIEARSYQVIYGNPLLQLEYDITYGTILPNDTLSGEIYKVSGNNVGVYDINSTLNLGRNYQIEYKKGSVTILPINLKIDSQGASKTYGQTDPSIPYTIVEGALINGDILTGKLSRQAGEDVGKYQLLENFTNPNYKVEVLTANHFEIKPKQVSVYIMVEDKVFDNTYQATIRRAEVVGVIDNQINLVYSKTTSANFVSKEVGNQIEVVFSNIYLSGDKAFNYTLDFPKVFANITYNQLTENNIKVYAAHNTQLTDGTTLNVSKIDTKEDIVTKNQKVVSTFNIDLENNNEKLKLEQDVIISVDLQNPNYQNVKVYIVDENNNKKLVISNFKNGNLTFSTNQLGDIVIVADNLTWLDISAAISLILLSSMLAAFIYSKMKKNKLKSKS